MPAHNAFRYRIYQLLLDLDELDELAGAIPFLSLDRRNLVEVRAADHLGDPRLSIRDNLRAWLDSRGVSVPDGRIELLTHARTFGYVFNPVSFYFVRNRDDSLACVVAEVHNTFGERWPYLLGAPGELDAGRPHALQHGEALPRLAVHGRLGHLSLPARASPASA